MEGLIMALVRSSNNLLSSFPSLIDRFFEGNMFDWGNDNFATMNSTLPAVNIMENENEFRIEVAAPGMRKEDFKVKYDNGQLVISSERKEEKKEEKRNKYSRHEFSYQSFQRTFSLSENMVNGEKIEARYHDGILQIAIPKREEVKPKPAKEIAIV